MKIPSIIRVPALTWGKQNGWVSLPVMHEKWHERWFLWPNDLVLIAKWVERANQEACVYWSPLVYQEATRREEEAHKCTSLWAWADLDDSDPAALTPAPTILWETSPGRYQSLYRLANEVDAKTLEEVNRRIASASNADPSGVDAGQVLRVPGTRNHKYPTGPRGKIVKVQNGRYSLTDLRQYSLPEADLKPAAVQAGSLSYKQALEKYEERIPWEAWPLLDAEEATGDRSVTLWTLIRALVDAEVPADGVYALAQGSVWNKFQGRNDEQKRLIREIQKAVSLKKDSGSVAAITEPEPQEDRRHDVKGGAQAKYSAPEGWLSRYVYHANKGVPGAPIGFHMACGLSLLSAAVGRLVTAGSAQPNLYPVMYTVLVGQTRSGKSRSQDFAMRVWEASGLEAEIRSISAFSPEGLVEAFRRSPSQQVFYAKDELSQLLRQTIRPTSYMAGAIEQLNELFAGAPIRRDLKKETIVIQSPHLTIMGLLTPEAYMRYLSPEAIDSGFVPRLLQIYHPEPGLPEYSRHVAETDAGIEELGLWLRDLRHSLKQAAGEPVQIRIGTDTAIAQPRPVVEADFTADAWHRLIEWRREIDMAARRKGDSSIPIMAELGQYGLKIAMLFALSRRPEFYMGGFQVTEEDVKAAIAMLESEIQTNEPLYELLGADQFEMLLHDVLAYIRSKQRVRRSDVFRKFGPRVGPARNMDEIEKTLEGRGYIVVRHGGGQGRRRFVEYVAF